MEHNQVRQMLHGLALAVEQSSKEEALGIFETLLITLPQHNLEEEGILYSLADQWVPGIAPHFSESMKKSGLVEKRLEVRGLESPMVPMERILDVLETLAEDDWLRVALSREPYPLYTLMHQMEFAWDMHRSGIDVTIRIWRAERFPPGLLE